MKNKLSLGKKIILMAEILLNHDSFRFFHLEVSAIQLFQLDTFSNQSLLFLSHIFLSTELFAVILNPLLNANIAALPVPNSIKIKLDQLFLCGCKS